MRLRSGVGLRGGLGLRGGMVLRGGVGLRGEVGLGDSDLFTSTYGQKHKCTEVETS